MAWEVLKVLRRNKLFLKAEKCEFKVLETEYLRVIISEGSIWMDPVKIKGILNWPVPQKKQELQSLLGFTNFYRQFIKGYSKLSNHDPADGASTLAIGDSARECLPSAKETDGQGCSISNTNRARQIPRGSRL